LHDKPVLFRVAGIPIVYAGVVRLLESDGFWIEAPSFIDEMQRDSAWKPLFDNIHAPILFVPTANLVYLIAAKE
jgi:hypothetical protein